MSGTQTFSREANFPQNHIELTASDTVDFGDIYLVIAGSAGTVAAVDKNGTLVTYTVTAGQLLPIPLRRVNLTGTTATPLIGIW